jgi:hypothetical protein
VANGAALQVSAVFCEGTVRPFIALHSGVAWIKVTGTNGDPADQVERMAAFSAGGGFHTSFVLSPRILLTPGVDAVLLIPRAVIHFGEAKVATFGSPLVFVTLQLELLR